MCMYGMKSIPGPASWLLDTSQTESAPPAMALASAGQVDACCSPSFRWVQRCSVCVSGYTGSSTITENSLELRLNHRNTFLLYCILPIKYLNCHDNPSPPPTCWNSSSNYRKHCIFNSFPASLHAAYGILGSSLLTKLASFFHLRLYKIIVIIIIYYI